MIIVQRIGDFRFVEQHTYSVRSKKDVSLGSALGGGFSVHGASTSDEAQFNRWKKSLEGNPDAEAVDEVRFYIYVREPEERGKRDFIGKEIRMAKRRSTFLRWKREAKAGKSEEIAP